MISRFLVPSVCLAAAVAVSVAAQTERKAGLWEMTITKSWQRMPVPPGAALPQTQNSPFNGTQSKVEVCVPQAMIEKYGAPIPPLGAECTVSHLAMKATSMTAQFSCSGNPVAIGTVKSSWAKADRITSTVHYSGKLQGTATRMGPDAPNASATSNPMEWTVESKSVYKGAECGSAPQLPMPAVQ